MSYVSRETRKTGVTHIWGSLTNAVWTTLEIFNNLLEGGYRASVAVDEVSESWFKELSAERQHALDTKLRAIKEDKAA